MVIFAVVLFSRISRVRPCENVHFNIQCMSIYCKYVLVLGVKKHFTLLIVNNSKSLKPNLLIFIVKIAEQCTILLGVVLMQYQSSLFHDL